MLQNVINDIFEIVIIVSISILAIYLLLPFINKKYEVKWRKWIWILLAIRLLIPYNFSISTTPIRFLTDMGVTQKVSQAVNQASESNIIMENGLDASALMQQSQKEGFKTPIEGIESIFNAIWNANIYVKLVFIWALGMIMTVSIHLVMYFVFRRNCISNCEKIEDINILRCIEKAKRICNINKQIPVYYCSTISSPMMMGIVKTILLIPKQKYEENELEVILKHECTHYQSKDLWYKAFMTLVSDIYWFNPIVILMKRQAFKDLELVCDQIVVKGMDTEERALYSNTLIHVGRCDGKEITYSTCFISNKKIIKERIERIFDMSKKKNGSKFLILLVTVFIVGSLFVACDSKRVTLNDGVNGEEVIQEEIKPKVGDSNELQFNLDSTNIHSLKYPVSYSGEMEYKEITNKEDLSKVIEYLNSLSLPATSDRPKDAINKFSFKDNNGNVIKEFSFGDSGVLWVSNETYILGSSNINTLKFLLRDIDK